ncbi:MAG: glycoside hydrolase family 31 protein [Parasphingorhabdus sp.]|nr:glycoside hydrolase family 31 protein [Parasphingorhabdus sp.]
MGYVNPYLAVDGPQFAEAQRLGHLALQIDGDTPYAVDFGEFDAGVVDFTSGSACEWFAEEIIGKHMLDFGLSGWMADFGEYLPTDLRLHDGSDPMRAHNRWPVLWAKVNADAIAARGKTGDALFFMRAGFSGSQRHCALLWAGDQSVDFSRHDGIGTVITAALSAGLVGNPYSHHDVGGYTSLHGNVRTNDLMMRWIELGAFTPVMRSHEGNRPDDNLQIDSTPEILAHFAAMSRVHAALAPYVRSLCDVAVATGLPLQRPLFLHFPDDPHCHEIFDQYLYGEDMLIAPIVTENAHDRMVYLPETTGRQDFSCRTEAASHWVIHPHSSALQARRPLLARGQSAIRRSFCRSCNTPRAGGMSERVYRDVWQGRCVGENHQPGINRLLCLAIDPRKG